MTPEELAALKATERTLSTAMVAADEAARAAQTVWVDASMAVSRAERREKAKALGEKAKAGDLTVIDELVKMI